MMAARTAAPLPSLLMICLRLVRFNSFLFSSFARPVHSSMCLLYVPSLTFLFYQLATLNTSPFPQEERQPTSSIADKGERDTSIRNRIGHDRDI